MRHISIAAAMLLGLGLLIVASAPSSAQQRLRERIAQRLQQRGGADTSGTSVQVPAGTRVLHDLAYGVDPKQRYDVYLPAHPQAGAPIVFMVHGGGWRRGDKAYSPVVQNKADYWLGKGFVFVSANNRLVPEANPLQQARDIAAAVASVQQHAAQWDADPQRMILMGHSAGAHLVALLGSQPALLQQAGAQRPRGVVALDSGALDVPSLMSQARVPQLYHDAFGADSGFWQTVSPQQQLGRDALPMLLVCSSTRHFPTSPCAEAGKLAQRAATLSVPAEVLPEALSHGEINAQLGLPSAYTDAVSRWIDHALMQVRH